MSQWLATVFVAGVSMCMTFLFGRLFGPELFGSFSYILTLTSLFAILQGGGFQTLIFREQTVPSISLERRKLFSSALCHVLAVTSVGILLTAFLSVSYRPTLALAVLSFGLGIITMLISAHLKGDGRFLTDAWWRVIVRSVTALTILFCIFYFSPTPQWAFVGWIFGYLAVLLFQRNQPLNKIEFRLPDFVLYKSVVALVVVEVATLIYFKIDIVMLTQMGLSMEKVGYYAAASRILEGIIFIFMPIANVLFRNLRMVANDPDRFMAQVHRLLVQTIFVALLTVYIAWMFGGKVLIMTFGVEYQQGADLFKWLVVALLFMIPNIIVMQAMLATNQDNKYARIASVAAFLNIVLNFYFIPLYEGKGAVYSTIVTEAFLLFFIMREIYSWRSKRGHPL